MSKLLEKIVKALGQEHEEQFASGRLEQVSSLGKSEGASNRELARDKLWDEQRDTVPPAIEVQTPANPHEIIEEKLKHAEVEPPYGKEKSRVSLIVESWPHKPQIDMRGNWDNVIQDKHIGDDADMGTESVEADLFSPLFLPEEHQPEEMTSALMPGVELPLNINDNVGRHVKPMDPEPIVSVHSRGELLPNINDNIGMHAQPVEPEPIKPVQSRGEQPPFINDKIGRQAKPLEPELIESVQSRVELPTNVNDNIVSQAKPVEPEPIESVQSRGELPPNINDYIGSHVKPVKQELTKSVQSRGELPPIINDNIERHDKPLEPEPMDSVQSRGELPTNVSDNIVSHAKPVEPEPIESVQSRGELLPNINDNIVSHAQLVEPEPIESVQSRGELHPNINDNIGSHVKPVDPEPKESIQSTPDQASLFKEIKIEAPEKLHDPESGRKGDDSYEGNETVEVDLSSSPLLSEKHQSEEIPDASTLGSELPTNINDTIGKNVEPAEPESVTSVQSTPNQANLLEEIKIEIAGNSDASGSSSKVALVQTIPTPEEVITTEEVCTERSPESDSSILTTVATGATQDDETMVYIGVQTDAPTDSGERRQWEWDILKAIVYGGLLESIASLSVVSAAASSDVATLNIVALGLANLVGGLPVLIHNLMELKNKQQESLDGKEQVDLYVEFLGRREHFYRHATIALLSYVLFGALPPVIYGFSFWQSDKKALKLIVVAAASLLCITLLALGKAHVQEQKAYGKTLLYYLGIGVGASGVSYAFGILIKQLLESLGLFDDGADVSASPISSILDVMSANLS